MNANLEPNQKILKSFNIESYVKKFNVIEDVDIELQKLENILREASTLQNLIKQISTIYKPLSEKIKINLELPKTLEDLKNDYSKILEKIKKGQDYDARLHRKLMNEIEFIQSYVQDVIQEQFNIKKHIYSFHIQVLKLINLRLESQKKLDLLLNEFKTIETLEKIIIELYQKKFSILGL